MNESIGSKGSGSDQDEPLVPDDFDDDFFMAVKAKIPQIAKALRQKDTHDNADNVQRLLIISNRYKANWHSEQKHSQELIEEIACLQERLETSAKMSQLDQDTITELKNVIETAWRQKDAAQMREQVAHDEVLRLRNKVENLEETLKALSDKRMAMQAKRDEFKEREALKAEIKELNKRIQIQRSYTNEIEETSKALEEKHKELLKILDETTTEAYNNRKRNDILQAELTQLKSEDQKNKETIIQLSSKTAQLTKMKVRQNLQVLSLKTNLEQLNTQYNATCNKLAKTVVELEYAINERDKNKRDLVQRINLLKAREDEMIKMKQENGKLAKVQESTARKYASLEEAKREAEDENIRLRTQLNTQDKELESMRRIVHRFEKNNQHLTKERDVLKRDLFLEHQTAEETDEQFQESQHEIKSLKDSLHLHTMKYKKLKEDFMKLEKEKLKKIDEVQNLLDKLDALKNEIHLKENYELELKRTINDLEVKCSKFQAQHDALVNEKNCLQRAVQTAEEDKTKLKQQIENMEEKIETLKGNVAYRDGEISRLQLQNERMEKERRMLRNEVRNAQLGQQHTRADMLEKKKENDRFSKALQEDVSKLTRMKRELDNIIDEKNNISVSLSKRNEEYAQLKSELENLQTAYNQTMKQLSQYQDDMRLMGIEIKNLRTERNVLRKDRENAADLRQELLQMHRQLNQERIKARALQEEMVTPMNIHRWRSLRGKDPEKMDLIERIQVLRRHILNQNITSMEQERALEEYQRIYEALKEFMLKLPSYKVKDELNAVKSTLSAKERKLKALSAELKTRSLDEKSQNDKLEEMKQELNNAKVQLNEEKKKKQKLIEERQIFLQMQQCFSAPPNMQRTLGGGFKLSLPTASAAYGVGVINF